MCSIRYLSGELLADSINFSADGSDLHLSGRAHLVLAFKLASEFLLLRKDISRDFNVGETVAVRQAQHAAVTHRVAATRLVKELTFKGRRLAVVADISLKSVAVFDFSDKACILRKKTIIYFI